MRRSILILVAALVGNLVNIAAWSPVAAQEPEENPLLCSALPPIMPVPPDHIVNPAGPLPTIQDALAIGTDVNGDGWVAICVDPGTYPGGVVIDEAGLGGLDVAIFGVQGSSSTVVTATQTPSAPRGFDIVGFGSSPLSWTVTLRGLTVRDFAVPPAEPWEDPEVSGGGAARAAEVLLVLDDIAALDNSAEGPGGALSLLSTEGDLTSVVVSGNNSATWGGGIYVDGLSTLRFDLGEVRENTATEAGGGVYLDYRRVGDFPAELTWPGRNAEFLDSTVADNVAAVGGGVLADWIETLDLSRVSFERNAATGPLLGAFAVLDNSGGALVAVDLIGPVGGGHGLVVDDCLFHDNEADARGGAAALFNTWTHGPIAADIVNTDFSLNHAGGGGSLAQGGALWTTWDQVDMWNCSFDNNTAAGPAASAPMGQGGAVYAAGDTLIEWSSLRFNSCDGDGGAIAVTAPAGSVTEPLLTLNASVVEDNRAGDSASGRLGRGGGIFASADLALAGVGLVRNVASGSGGGAALVEDTLPSSAAFSSVGFADNEAHSMGAEGGGGMFSDLDFLALNGVAFTGNEAGLVDPVEGLLHDGPGGGLDIRADADLYDVQFTSNRANEEAGGGLHCDGLDEPGAPETRFEGELLAFTSNLAWTVDPTSTNPLVPSFGGGASIERECDAIVGSSEFALNEAVRGGGLAVRGTEFFGYGLYVHDQGPTAPVAAFAGGGLYVNDPRQGDFALHSITGANAWVEVQDSTFENNEAQWSGGGARLECRGSAPSIPVPPPWDVTLADTAFLDNVVAPLSGPGSGGGAAEILDCWANLGGSSDPWTWWSNKSAPTGGALKLAYDRTALLAAPPAGRGSLLVSMTNVGLVNNVATVSGGGIQMDGARLEMKTGGLVGNDGGALGGGLAATADPTVLNDLTITESTIVYNTSSVAGGGLWFQGDLLTLGNVLVAVNTSPESALYATNASPWLPGATLAVDFDRVTISGNHTAGGSGPFTALVVEDQDPSAGSASGAIDETVIAMNETPAPASSWQADGLGLMAVATTLLFAHDPVESDPALLCDDPTGASGGNPLFVGGDVTGDSSSNIDPWNLLDIYYDFHGVEGGPVGPPVPGAGDQTGAFTGALGGWCDSPYETWWCARP